MATRVETVTHYTDDIDGGKAEGTVAFSFDGTNYEIDLSKKNRTALAKALSPYVDAARKVRSPRGRGSSGSSSNKKPGSDKARLQAIREWARENGIEVAERGRISKDIQSQYDAAN